MSVSSRNRRAIVYPYTSSSDHGYMTSAYGPARGTYFCRLTILEGTEATVAAQAEHRQKVLFEFADAVTIGENDLIVENAVQYRVAGVLLRRAGRCLIVTAYRVDDEPAVVPS